MDKQQRKSIEKTVEEMLMKQYVVYMVEYFDDNDKHRDAWLYFLQAMIENCEEKLEILKKNYSE